MTEQQKKTLGLAVGSLVCGCFFLIPLLGFIMSLIAIVLGIVAVVQISNNEDTLKGKGLAVAGIVMGGFGIMIIPIVALLAAIAIPNFIRAKISAQDALAQSTLETLSVASETYATANEGRYPSSAYDLTNAQPPYISENYCNQEISGYTYLCQFGADGYVFMADPVEPGISGTTQWSITTGGIKNTPAYSDY